MDGTATLVIWRPQESQFNNVAGLLEGFALNKLYVAKGYKPSRYHRQPLRPKGRRLAFKLRRSSAYLERRVALASSPDASGAVDNRLALAQSCAGQGEYGCNAHTRTASLYWVDSPVRRAQKLDTPGWLIRVHPDQHTICQPGFVCCFGLNIRETPTADSVVGVASP